MEKKYQNLIIIILALILLSAFIFLIVKNKKEVKKEEQKQIVYSEISVYGQNLENYVQKLPDENAIGDKLLEGDTENFKIYYMPRGGWFYIDIFGKPFEGYKKKAEDRFLEITGRTPENVCELQVYIGTPPLINPDYANEEYRLRWCE